MELIIAQINAQRSAAVAADICTALVESNIDILCIQEPYSSDGRVRGFSSLNVRVIQPSTGVPMVAIVINNPNIDILQLNVKDSKHVVAVQVVTENCDFYLFSAYFQFSHPVEPYLATLEDCITKIKCNNISSQIVITADVNASSASWYSRTTDDRGESIEEFIAANNLVVLNQASRFTTYASPSGTSNIDVTLATPGIAGFIYDWHVSPEMTISDHNAILFRMLPHRPRVAQPRQGELHFNIKRSNWEPFDEELRGAASPSFKAVVFTPAAGRCSSNGDTPWSLQKDTRNKKDIQKVRTLVE